MEPTSNCSSASGGARFAGAATIMQAVESQKVILYQTDLRGQWPEGAAKRFAARLPYPRRLALRPSQDIGRRASLAGVALAVRALGELLQRKVAPGEIRFARGEKPRLVPPAVSATEVAAADFSISHSGPWVACAALAGGSVGLDVEMGTDERIADWVVREATLKAGGEGLRGVRALRELAVAEGCIRWRGASWQLQRLEGFAGAAACIVCDAALAPIERRHIVLHALFDS